MEKNKITQIWVEFKRYALYEDYRELYDKTVKPMQKFEQEMIDYSKSHKQMELMIKKFDENLSLKSNKTDIWKIETDLDNFISQKELDDEVKKLDVELR